MSNQDFTPHPALVPLLDGLFDYAGLFPPAALNMDAAVDEYLEHKRGPERSMVGPFVVPAARLTDMQRAFEAHSAGAEFTLLPRPAETAELLEEDFSAAKLLEEQSGQSFRCVAVESRIPFPSLDTAQYASRVRIALNETGLTPDRVFLEIPRDADFETRLAPYFEALGNMNGPPLFAGKLRCGGPAAKDHPSSRDVAQFILAGIRAGTPFKFTAGLHHPFRHLFTDVSTGTDIAMHGFVNVMFATAVAASWHEADASSHTSGLSGVMEEILDEYAPESFRCIDDEIRWKEIRILPGAFRHVRSELALGIGSCSINEPLEDLSRYFPLPHTYVPDT